MTTLTGLAKRLLWLSKLQQPTPSSPTRSDDAGMNEPDLHWNYLDYQSSAIKDQELRRQMSAKALNMPYDTMGDISVQNRSGAGAIAMLVIGIAAALGGAGGLQLLLPLLAKSAAKAPIVQQPTRSTNDSDTRYDLVPLPGE